MAVSEANERGLNEVLFERKGLPSIMDLIPTSMEGLCVQKELR